MNWKLNFNTNTKTMKNRFFLIATLLLCLTGTVVSGQDQEKELRLSLKDAQAFAIDHNKMVISSRMDLETARISLKEMVTNTLPHVNASGNFADNLKLMTTLLPGDFFGRPGEKVPVTFGSQFNSGASIDAAIAIFNAPVYIGIEVAKLARQLSEENLTKSELDTKASVAQAYYLILISERSLTIIDANIANLKEILKSTRAMYQAGMAEATDIDQMASNVTAVETSRSSLERTIEVNYNLLRFQLGLSTDSKLILTDTLEGIESVINVDTVMSQAFDYRQNVDYRLIDGQEKMSLLVLKNEKASVLPVISGFYTYGTSGMGDKVSELRWFPNSIAGFQVSFPIFASTLRYQSIKKAQVNLNKAKNEKSMVTDLLLLQEKQLRYNLISANLQYKNTRDNIDVSKRVYTSIENKYKQGMASSLELTQANGLYLQAENNYITSLMNLLQTKLAFDKLLNNL
jgi:outer membrane protein TolC